MDALDETRLVDVLEALYALERNDEEWLTQVLRALKGVCGKGYRYVAVFYDASDVENFKIWNECRLQDGTRELPAIWSIFWSIAKPNFVSATLRSPLLGSARKDCFDYLNPLIAERDRNGHGDFFCLNALDPSGLGCLLTVGSPEQTLSLEPRDAALLKRIATHLSSAYRCRRRLAPADGLRTPARTVGSATAGAEAVLNPAGEVLHASGAACSTAARERIRVASTAIELARTSRGRSHGTQALAHWHPLADARWTLVDSFEENGRRFIVARENQQDASGLQALTDRERQVVIQASLGQTNKEIAYALGVSPNTVRVLMARAAARLGARGRKELLARIGERAR